MNQSLLIQERYNIGKELMLERVKKNWSISFFARLTKLSRITIYNIESGKIGYTIDTLIIYKHGLNKKIIFEDVE
jgi:transcriptional regulator with XRE-family HTH domain